MKNGSKKIIEVADLKIGYEDEVVLQDLNFSVAEGEIFVILGGSGSGKSTLLKHMIGLYNPFSGTIFIKGEDISHADWEQKRRLMRGFGVTYQSGALFGSLSLAENIALPLEEYTGFSKELIAEIIHEKLRLVGLEGQGERLPSEISGGMNKRAGIARAMALDPDLLFFDEPSAGLDPVSAASLDRLILDIRDRTGTTIVIVTHELDSIFTVADRLILLDKKRKIIAAEGEPYELRDKSPDKWVRDFLNRGGLRRKNGNIKVNKNV